MCEGFEVIASGYTIHLYCDNENIKHAYNRGFGEYEGETWNECVKQAKTEGWNVIKKTRVCYCPDCNGKRKD